MYGLSDTLRESEGNAEKLDKMVTVAKKALEEIAAKASSRGINDMDLIASKALLNIERLKGK